MKIERLERMRELQRAYHRRCRWVTKDGLYIPHSYEETPPDALSWWDDVGFILGDRRVIVWWVHPRMSYEDEIQERAWSEAGESPHEGGLFGDTTPNYKQIGRSRKKRTGYTTSPPQGELRQYYDKLDAIEERLRREGIDFDVHLSWRRERLPWATGVKLIAPLEVRNETELKAVADLARRLLLSETSLDCEFPDYSYGRGQWLADYSFIKKT